MLLLPCLFLPWAVLCSLVAVDPQDPIIVAVPSDVEKMRVQVRAVETTGTEANSLGHGQALGPCIRSRVIDVNTAASRPWLNVAVGRRQLPAVKDQDDNIVGGIVIQDRVVRPVAVTSLAGLALRLEIHPRIRLEVVTPEGMG